MYISKMVETNQKSTDKYHGIKSFPEDGLEWGKDALQKKCKLTPKSVLGNDPVFGSWYKAPCPRRL